MRILLTGATGFLGGHLKARLVRGGHTVDFLGRTSNLSSFEIPDAIINCAAELDKADLMIEANLLLPLKLLQYARTNKIKKFIQIGSSSETGPVEGIRTENTPCNPTNLYEATKLAATHLCIGYAKQYDLDVSIARPFSLYGPNDKFRKFLPSLYRAAKEGSVFHLFPGGHDWFYVDDFVDGIILLLDADANITKGEIFNFGTGISTSNSEVAHLFAQISGFSIEFEPHIDRYRDYDVIDWRASYEKANKLLGWTPKIDLATGLKKIIIGS